MMSLLYLESFINQLKEARTITDPLVITATTGYKYQLQVGSYVARFIVVICILDFHDHLTWTLNKFVW